MMQVNVLDCIHRRKGMFEMSRPRVYGTTQAVEESQVTRRRSAFVYAICIFSALFNANFVAHVYLCLRDFIFSLQCSSTVPSRWHPAQSIRSSSRSTQNRCSKIIRHGGYGDWFIALTRVYRPSKKTLKPRYGGQLTYQIPFDSSWLNVMVTIMGYAQWYQQYF